MENIDNIFIEQAEYLNENDFDSWSLDHPNFENLFTKLSGPGAKLIIGPRGSGKTTILKKALLKINQTTTKRAVYINFKKSLSLEPFYRSNLNPSFYFNQWLLAKTYIAILESGLIGTKKNAISMAKDVVQRLENGSDLSETNRTLSYEDIFQVCEEYLESEQVDRLIIFMDDAAHAFSPEQQRDFFDFFRTIKTKKLSPKAAIYPGVTVFSPAFQVGHDAEQIDIWIDPVSDEYVNFLKDVLSKRLPEDIFLKFNKTDGLVDLIAYSSFGIPRNFLNLVRDIWDHSSGGNIGPSLAFEAISKSCKRSNELFLSLKDKLTRYSNYVQTGQNVFNSGIKEIKNYNRDKLIGRQSITIALKAPIDENLLRVIGFLEYSGLIFPLEKDVSRGIKGTFKRYYISIAHIVESNAVVVSKGKKVDSFVEAIRTRHAHEFTRIGTDKLLENVDLENGFKLALSPCMKCTTPRLNEAAKFCHICGAPLTEASIFYELIEKDISALPLTTKRIKSIKTHSTLRSIKDVLNDIDHRKLRSIPQVGEFWAKRIYEYAEEYIS